MSEHHRDDRKNLKKDRVRERIARMAAQMMYEREEKEYFTAKRKAARQLGIDYKYSPKDLPSNREIRDHVQALACFYEGDKRVENLKAMRLEAFWLMRKLERFSPHLIGSVWTGHIRKGSDIDLHIFCDHLPLLTELLDELGLNHTVEHKRVIKHSEERRFTHLHISSKYEFELTVYPTDKTNYSFKSSITGKAMELATLRELEQFLQKEYPDFEPDAADEENIGDAYELFKMLLLPLENVKQNPKYHPEGDALFHSLQVFELAKEARPYDEEFLLAALLHDVGKAIDPSDHVLAGILALEGAITDRTEYLIEHHMEAHQFRNKTLGFRARQQLAQEENFEDLLLLSECDKGGRKPGAWVGTVDEALEYIRSLSEENHWGGEGADK